MSRGDRVAIIEWLSQDSFLHAWQQLTNHQLEMWDHAFITWWNKSKRTRHGALCVLGGKLVSYFYGSGKEISFDKEWP